MRQMNSRLIRKGLGFSKPLSMDQAAAGWEDAIYNLSDAPGLANRSNGPAERPAGTALEEANACNGSRAHRSGVVNQETAPNCADNQHIIGPPHVL